MKQNKKWRSLFGLEGSAKILLSIAFICVAFLTSCSNDELDETVVESSLDLKAASSATTSGTIIEEVTFSATALIAHCHGENIAFTGTIQNRVSKTTDARGVIHYTRSFRTRGMTGTGATSGIEYDVIGGAEMFAVKDAVLNPNGTLNVSGSIAASDIVIHQGTLVFQSREDGSRVVARHVIRKVPGSDTVINEWKCGGSGR